MEDTRPWNYPQRSRGPPIAPAGIRTTLLNRIIGASSSATIPCSGLAPWRERPASAPPLMNSAPTFAPAHTAMNASPWPSKDACFRCDGDTCGHFSRLCRDENGWSSPVPRCPLHLRVLKPDTTLSGAAGRRVRVVPGCVATDTGGLPLPLVTDYSSVFRNLTLPSRSPAHPHYVLR